MSAAGQRQGANRIGIETPDAGPTMSPKTYQMFRELIYARSGINLGGNKVALVASRVGKRMRHLGITSFENYLDRIRNDASGDELTHFVDSISTNVTSFFRERHHFSYLHELVARWREERRTKVRIWSAACSTGEEPYTIAMTMLEALQGAAIDFRILATDISTRVLEKAMRGEYPEDKVSAIPPALKAHYWRRVGAPAESRYAVNANVRENVIFRQVNLAETPYALRGPLDVIFCRNVMIYFDNQVRLKLLGEFFRLLRPGGILFVGHAESLTGLTTEFKPVRASIYLKP